MTLRLDSQTLHISYPSAGQYVDAPLDGVDAAVHGPHGPKGVTYTVRLVGRREISILTKRNGNPLTQGSLELSDDGRAITDSWWKPGQPADKSTFVYEKKQRCAYVKAGGRPVHTAQTNALNLRVSLHFGSSRLRV